MKYTAQNILISSHPSSAKTCSILHEDSAQQEYSAMVSQSASFNTDYTERGTKLHNDSGFSLLELVVAVSIMLILGVVGTVSYQTYTDNARQAALDTSASDVLTAVIAEDNVPNGDVEEAVKHFNNTSDGIVVDIQSANRHGMVIRSMTCDGNVGTATVAGNHEHVETTSFIDVHYDWIVENGNDVAVKRACGEIVAKNHAQNPRALPNDGWTNNIRTVWNQSHVQVDDHPLGITTALKSHFTDQDYVDEARDSLSLYDVGGVPRGQEQFYFGVWVKTDTPGKVLLGNDVDPIEIPTNKWVFVTSGNEKIGWNERHQTVIAGLRVRHDKDLFQDATSWATGAVVSYDTPVTEFFDGDM